MSTCSHLAAPASAGLFQRAIIQSGPCTLEQQWPYADGNWTVRPRKVAERQGQATAEKLHCDSAADAAACLRGKSVTDLLEASDGGQGFGPAAGGRTLPMTPATALATGHFAHVPVIQGTTHDEHRTFVAAIESFTGHAVTDADYRKDIEDFFGPDKAEKILARYRGESPSVALAGVWTDSAWSCTALQADRLLSAQVPTYAYEFADEKAPWASDGTTPSFPTGAFHAAELQYLFDDEQFRTPLTAGQEHLSEEMIGYWTRFAHTGNPNGGAAPSWPRFDGDHVRSLTTGGTGRTDLAKEHHCGFWKSLGE
jgi:para-nitrobenzyl esterase